MEYDNAYLGNFLAALDEMRKSDIMCDFTVKVGNESLNVHRAVLAAASKYFTAMFSSKMREAQEAFVDMKSLSVVGVRKCIEYMYSGGVKLENDSVEDTLKASDLIQLTGLISICSKFLKNNLSVETCLCTVDLSRIHGLDDVSILAENYVLKNFKEVILTKMFLFISKCDLLHYIEASDASYYVIWQALMRWFSVAREEPGLMLDVMKSVRLATFPFQFLLETVLNEPLLKQDGPCNKLVLQCLFNDAEKMNNNLSAENFFVVKNLIKMQEIPNFEEIKNLVDDYLAENLQELLEYEGFKKLEEEEIVCMFRSSKSECSSEKTKWNAALTWIKHDEHSRKNVFKTLFKLIKLELLSSDFLQYTIRNETLVEQSHECKDVLLDLLFARGKRESINNEHEHILICDVKNGNLKALNLITNEWKDFPILDQSAKCQKPKQIMKVDANVYCLFDDNILTLKQGNAKWIQNTFPIPSMRSYSIKFVVFKKYIFLVGVCDTACYDLTNNTWEKQLPGCSSYDDICLASSDKFIYAMGGSMRWSPVAYAERFDPDTQSWSKIASMNTCREKASAAVFQTSVYVVGGYNGEEYLSSVEFYHPLVKSWTSVQNMCVRRIFSSLCVANCKLYVVGGVCNEEGVELDENLIETYDENENAWRIVKKCHPALEPKIILIKRDYESSDDSY